MLDITWTSTNCESSQGMRGSPFLQLPYEDSGPIPRGGNGKQGVPVQAAGDRTCACACQSKPTNAQVRVPRLSCHKVLCDELSDSSRVVNFDQSQVKESQSLPEHGGYIYVIRALCNRHESQSNPPLSISYEAKERKVPRGIIYFRHQSPL